MFTEHVNQWIWYSFLSTIFFYLLKANKICMSCFEVNLNFYLNIIVAILNMKCEFEKVYLLSKIGYYPGKSMYKTKKSKMSSKTSKGLAKYIAQNSNKIRCRIEILILKVIIQDIQSSSKEKITLNKSKYVNTVCRSSFRNLYYISIPALWMPATLLS